MKNGWETKTLADLCEISSALVDPRQPKYQKLLHVGGANIESATGRLIALQSAKDEGLISGKFFFDERAVLYSKIRPYLMKVARPDFKGLCSADIYPLMPREGFLDRGFLYYVLLTPRFTDFAIAGSARAGMPKVNREHLFAYSLAVPPLPEQRRIVGLLDEAFAGIATAQAHAEKNLQNARALFESHLQAVFTQRGKGWVEKPVVQCFKVRSGDFLPAKAMVVTGRFDVYGGNGVTGKHDQKNLSGENIIIGRVGAKCGNVRRVLGDLWLTDNAFFISEYFQDFDLAFLARLLELKQLRRTANQAAQPVISFTTIKDIMLEFPLSKTEQGRIAEGLEKLENETQRLAGLYARKLAALAALKKSLLHQAFAGEL
jgi:type I restriction enzyme S subunit